MMSLAERLPSKFHICPYTLSICQVSNLHNNLTLQKQDVLESFEVKHISIGSRVVVIVLSSVNDKTRMRIQILLLKLAVKHS